MSVCWNCEFQVQDGWKFCPNCGTNLGDRTTGALYVVDATTGLFNAVFMQAVIGQEANRAVRYKRALSVLVVEADHAESIHREMSAAQLNQLLKELADTLVRSVRDVDTVGFLEAEGPPHFVMVLPETDEAGALLAADKIRRSVASHDFQSGGNWQRLTVSVGIATVHHERIGPQDLIDQGFQALQNGRGSGPNRTTAFALPH
ncbi:MAG TPA: diguanylate cyclase [Candidatus Acidoferrales bacterium]|nr:diguanylate cyclase [Candidatus Acidoferrales bacterium]